jgi:DNA-binding transcriptional LysR family regulator
MLDALTLDQLRTLVTIADEGSFSAAARKLKRVQSAISHTVRTLEGLLNLELFDRSSKTPVLTAEGRAVLAAARRVLAQADALRALADELSEDLEPEVALCVDALFPTDILVTVCRDFLAQHPSVTLRVHTETLSAVAARVAEGSCQLGVSGPAALAAGLSRSPLLTVRMIPVVAPGHPLAAAAAEARRVPAAELAQHVQVVLSERGLEGQGATADQGVLSPCTWRVMDLATKHALLRGGLGWGNLPEHMLGDDLVHGRLVAIQPDPWSDDEHVLAMAAIHRPEARLGRASRWLLGRLRALCARHVAAAPQP